MKRAALRRATLHLIIGVMLVHSVALATYYFADVPHQSQRTQTMFTYAWLLTTAAVVALLLRRVRVIRRGR